MSDKDQFTFDDEEDDVSKPTSPETDESQDSELGYEDFSSGFNDKEDEAESVSLSYEDENEVSPGEDQEPADESLLSYDDEFAADDDRSVVSPASDEDADSSAAFGFDDSEEEPELDLGFGDTTEDALPDGFEETDNSTVASAPPTDPEPITDGSSRTKILLLVLLLVIAAGAGGYYFMGLGGTTPAVPTVPVPPATTRTTVPLPPQEEAPTAAGPEAKTPPATVTVPAPTPPQPQPQPQPDAAETKAAVEQKSVTQPQPAAAAPSAEVETAQQQTPQSKQEPAPAAAAAGPAAADDAAEAAKDQPAAEKVKEQVVTEPSSGAAAEAVAPKAVEKAAPVTADKSTQPVTQVKDGAFALDAGSYLLESNRDSLTAKIRKIGYEPLVTPVDATLSMTRLRLGTYDKGEVQDVLAFARTIEPGSYAAPAGDRFVIYAGTFLQSSHVDKVRKKFAAEGIKVFSEPVEVVRTLSRIRFGSFATLQDARQAAQAADRHGVKAIVVKSK